MGFELRKAKFLVEVKNPPFWMMRKTTWPLSALGRIAITTWCAYSFQKQRMRFELIILVELKIFHFIWCEKNMVVFDFGQDCHNCMMRIFNSEAKNEIWTNITNNFCRGKNLPFYIMRKTTWSYLTLGRIAMTAWCAFLTHFLIFLL